MSIISRRQKEILLSDVQRMINNNNHAAFANHAKISDCVSNGDLKFFIDSPKKEFVIKYGNREIRFNCSDQQMKELKSIEFNDGSIIKGISDSSLIPSSQIALSTAWGSQIKRDIEKKSSTDHNHDDKYAAKDHNHDDKYADINHTHNQYADKNHVHNQYADKNHTHNDYALKNHTHFGLDDKDDLEDFIKDVTKDPWYIKVFNGLGVINELAQDGMIATMEAQIQAITSILANDLGIDLAQTGLDSLQLTTGLGQTVYGYSQKLKNAADTIKGLGDKFKTVKKITDPLSEALNKAGDGVNKASKALDKMFDFSITTDYHRIVDSLPDTAGDIGQTINTSSSRLPHVFRAATRAT